MSLDQKLVKQIQTIGLKNDVDKIVLFGSRARGDHQLVSDIDLAVFSLPSFQKRGLLCS